MGRTHRWPTESAQSSSRQQSRAQAGIDHAQWRRQARRDAYSAFLAPAHEAGKALKQAARALIGDVGVGEADRRLRAAHDNLTAVHGRNVKFGERHAVEVTRVSGRISAFTAAARAALDDTTPASNTDGS